MALWLRRALIRGLIGPVAYGVVSVFLLLFYIWMLGGSRTNSQKIYKNYVERSFTDEIVADETKRAAVDKALSQVGQRLKTGTFVVIPIDGVILDENMQRIKDQLYIATNLTKDIKAIIFLVNSPGGGVVESDQLFEDVRRIRTRNDLGIKIVTFVNSLSASGAYYMTAQSDKIIASPVAVVGSIGVVMEVLDMEELSHKIGVYKNVIKSGEMKDIGSPFRKMSDNEKMVFRRIVDCDFERFKSIVQKGRGLSNFEIELLSTGEVWHAEDAKGFGLIDEIGYVNRAVAAAMELTGVNSPTVIIYEEEITFWDFFKARSPVVNLVKKLNTTVNNPGISTPKLFYMWVP